MNLVLLGLGMLVLALSMPYFVSPILHKLKLVDVPNHRSSHTTTTIRGGGIAVGITINIGLLVLFWLGGTFLANPSLVLTVLVAVTLTTSLGFVEDARGITVKGRILCQLFLSLAIATSALYVSDQIVLWALPLSLVGVFYINAANFMDGINGISSLHGILLGVTALVSGLIASNGSLTAVGGIIALAFLGFLPWNFPSARMFLGDAGSYLIGGLLFSIGLWIFFETNSLFLAIAPSSFYCFDVIFTLFVRQRRGEKLTEAHREHIYQRFQRRVGSHSLAAVVTTGFTTCTVLLALGSNVGLLNKPLSIILGIAVLSSCLPILQVRALAK